MKKTLLKKLKHNIEAYSIKRKYRTVSCTAPICAVRTNWSSAL